MPKQRIQVLCAVRVPAMLLRSSPRCTRDAQCTDPSASACTIRDSCGVCSGDGATCSTMATVNARDQGLRAAGICGGVLAYF